MTDLSTILSWFETGDTPTQEQFAQTLSSFRHQETKIPIPEVDGLETSLNNKLNAEDLPENLALVDAGQSKEVYNKEQIRAMTMMLSDYAQDGKIRADKVDALGLTDLIEATETSLAAFITNSNNYSFQKNDFIAIPDVVGNYTLFMFKGGEFSDAGNYLPTGLTSVTIGMVEGLQAALAGKLDQPNADGSYFITQSGEKVSYKKINSSLQHLLFWDGRELVESNVFQDLTNSRIGVGTLSPTEVLHIAGRLRASALVLDENTESLPGQITRSGGRFSGTDSGGVKRGFMYNDYEDYLALVNGLTDAQIDAVRQANLKSTETYSTNQPRIDNVIPPIVTTDTTDRQNVTLTGLNLYIAEAIIELTHIPTGQVFNVDGHESFQNNTGLLNFSEDFSGFPIGEYSIRIFNAASGVWSNNNTVSTLNIQAQLVEQPLPDLSWEIINANGDNSAEPSVVNASPTGFVTTTTESNFVDYVIKSSPLVTRAEKQAGVMLIFNVSASLSADARSEGSRAWLLTFMDSLEPLNYDYNYVFALDFRVSHNGAKFLPTGIQFQPQGYSPLDWASSKLDMNDKLYLTIKNNVVKVLLLSANFTTTQHFIIPDNLSIKACNFKNWGYSQSINLIKKYLLS